VQNNFIVIVQLSFFYNKERHELIAIRETANYYTTRNLIIYSNLFAILTLIDKLFFLNLKVLRKCNVSVYEACMCQGGMFVYVHVNYL